MYVPKWLRLKDEALIELWKSLVTHAEKAPRRPGMAHYVNVLDTELTVDAFRDRRDASMVWLMKMDRESAEAVSRMAPGESLTLVHTMYKVSTRYPFIIVDTTSTRLRVQDDDLDLDEAKKGRLARFRDLLVRHRIASRTALLTPTVQELEELLAYVTGAEMQVHDDVLSS